MMEFISSMFGTVVGAVLAYIFARMLLRARKESEVRERRIDLALSYYEELTGIEFSNARYEADADLRQHAGAASLAEIYAALPERKVQNIRIVLGFFRRLSVALKHKRIDPEMVMDLLAGEFFWWYTRWFEILLPANWETRRDIDQLNAWFVRHMPPGEYESRKACMLKKKAEDLARLATSGEQTSSGS